MTNKIKLLYITNGITGAGGLERVLSIKASYLVDRLGYEVHILSLNEPQAKPFYTFSPKIQFHNCEAKGNSISTIFSYIKGIKRTVAKIQPDIIAVCDDGLKGFFVPLILGKRIPLVYERHASVQLNFSNKSIKIKNKITHVLMQKLAGTFTAFVVLTQGNLKEWKSNHLKVLPNPLSFYPEATSELTNKRVIAVGSHSYNKGYDLLLAAWKQVVTIQPDWELHIYGKYDQDNTFIKLAKKLEIEKNIFFSPPVANIEKEYLDSSIMVLPSRSEGFGMVLIEAMACGLPCVSFDCPHGPADIITHGEDGLLVPNGNLEQLADALIDVMEHEQKRQSMGAAAKVNVKRYLPEQIMPLWDTLFKKLIHENCL